MTDRKDSIRRGTVPAVIAATLFAVAFLLANIPGNPVLGPYAGIPHEPVGPHFYCYVEEMVHGWPLPYLRHDGHRTPSSELPSAWKVGDNAHFTLAALGANVVLLAVGTFVTGWLVRRRIQKEGWSFGISHMLLATLCISVVMASTSSRNRLHQAQVAHLQRGHHGEVFAQWQPFGPYWLRRITGPRFWDWGDYLVGAEIEHSDEIAELPGRSEIKVLRISMVNCDAMPSLDDFHNLVAIEICSATYPSIRSDNKPEFWRCLRVISKCQSLQSINLYNNGVTDRDLQELVGMPNLKYLKLSVNPEVTDDGLVHLASIKSLKILGLLRAGVTKTGVEKLRAALPNCEIEWDETP